MVMRLFRILPVLLMLISCRNRETLFERISSSHSGITFNNQIVESDSVNSLDLEFLYNGGGVAVGDFNKDGQPDLYFTASQVANKLYINKGNFTFEDITDKAGADGGGRWCNAASVVDINHDGWLDIYVCATVKKRPTDRTNLLYVNQGLNKEGIPHFKEMAAQYGLADSSMSVQAAFFDYDRDGDLDMYLVNTIMAQRNSARFDGGTGENREALCDRLYRNEGSDSLGHPFFRNISGEAGICDDGYGLGIAVADINKDGWKDIYVTNDFLSSDLLYINNKDGTFTNKAKTCFKHTSHNAMGNDIADINNDGFDDIIAVDMNPEDNYRKKKNMSGGNYHKYASMINYNLGIQYVRNTLQLNNGLFTLDTSGTLLPSFSDIAFFAGVAETDWSWSPLFADFDNDGFKDLVITNGYPKDVTDHDFSAFRAKPHQSASKKELLEQIPQVKISNYIYRNTGNLKFQKVTDEWGLSQPTFSNGAVYVDLDGDGDLDYVINNINEEALVYQNQSEKFNTHNYLNLRFVGDNANVNGIGTIAEIYYGNGEKQTFENSPYRGYLSTVDDRLHFGLGKVNQIDSLIIKWADGKEQVIRGVAVNQTLLVSQKNALLPGPAAQERSTNALFVNITRESGIDYVHREFEFIDFNSQKLLPHKFSQFGPPLAAGDINNDGLDDFIVGASADNPGAYFLQQVNGSFVQRELPAARGPDARRPEMMGLLLFDADGDGDLDLYACSGSNEYAPDTKYYQDQFYRNTGKGGLVHDAAAIPVNYASKSCVKAADVDGDGDLDLFVGGRVRPDRYPEPVSSFIYRNDSKDGNISFTDITAQAAPELNKIGLVCDAVWTDFDNDGWQDLIVVGEWMPVTFFKNNRGALQKLTPPGNLPMKIGWWNSITAGDFDNDGDMDYVAGNLGLNSFFRASEKEPVSIYAADFDEDPSYDAIPAVYLPSVNGSKKEFPANVRDEVIKQMVSTRRKFPLYKDFALADINALLDKEAQKKALILRANYFESCYIQNNGSNRFELKPLPMQAQWSPVNGLLTDDVNGDGFLDIVLNGNDHGNEVVNGRYDALNGLVLLGDGKGEFQPLSLQQSGFYMPGDAKALAKLVVGNKVCFAGTQNRNSLQLFALQSPKQIVRLNHDDVYAILTLKDGRKRKVEVPYGSSFLSHSSRFVTCSEGVLAVDIVNRKGEKRRAETSRSS